MTTETTTKVKGFAIFDKTTGKVFATLPLTVPIGQTVDGFTRAGYKVSWHWVLMPEVTA
jgi:hypothetical protein